MKGIQHVTPFERGSMPDVESAAPAETAPVLPIHREIGQTVARPRSEARARRNEGSSDEWWGDYSPARFSPPIDVADDRTHIRVTVELPGVDDKDVAVEVQDDILIVRGEKKLTDLEAAARFYRVERAHGRFERTILLPTEVGSGGAEALFSRGILVIRLPKMRTSAPPRPVPVRCL